MGKIVLILGVVFTILLLAALGYIVRECKTRRKWYCWHCIHGKRNYWGGLLGDDIGCELEIPCKNFKPRE